MCSGHIDGRLGSAVMFGRLGILNAFSTSHSQLRIFSTYDGIMRMELHWTLRKICTRSGLGALRNLIKLNILPNPIGMAHIFQVVFSKVQ